MSKIEVLRCKPLILIPDVLKTSQEEGANTNQDQIYWFKYNLVSINFYQTQKGWNLESAITYYTVYINVFH